MDLTADILAAADAIRDAGRPIQIRGVETSFGLDTFGVFFDYTSNEVDGASVRWSDKRLLIAGNVNVDLDPETAPELYYIVDGTRSYQIVSVSSLQPGSQVAYYTLQVRR